MKETKLKDKHQNSVANVQKRFVGSKLHLLFCIAFNNQKITRNHISNVVFRCPTVIQVINLPTTFATGQHFMHMGLGKFRSVFTDREVQHSSISVLYLICCSWPMPFYVREQEQSAIHVLHVI